MKRRTLLKGSVGYGVLGVAINAGLLMPGPVLAAWSKSAFDAKGMNEALDGIFGSSNFVMSDDIKIKAPDIAENGAVVPITVSTNFENAEALAILVEKNPLPLTAKFDLGSTAQGFISTRIKMGKTSRVIVVVKADGKLYGASKEVKVTIGGCGG